MKFVFAALATIFYFFNTANLSSLISLIRNSSDNIANILKKLLALTIQLRGNKPLNTHTKIQENTIMIHVVNFPQISQELFVNNTNIFDSKSHEGNTYTRTHIHNHKYTHTFNIFKLHGRSNAPVHPFLKNSYQHVSIFILLKTFLTTKYISKKHFLKSEYHSNFTHSLLTWVYHTDRRSQSSNTFHKNQTSISPTNIVAY